MKLCRQDIFSTCLHDDLNNLNTQAFIARDGAKAE